jgi:hypothetical protein
LEQKVISKKESAYLAWQKMSESGQTQEDWSTYLRKSLESTPEFSRYVQLQEKFGSAYDASKQQDKSDAAQTRM